MRFDDVAAELQRASHRELPGPEAQARMAPRPRRFWIPGHVPIDARAAAGLVLIYPRDGAATLLLTVRGSHLATHRGQIALPGGGVDPGEGIEGAALREAEEEIGLRRSDAEPKLHLTPLHIPVSGYVLHPVVATCDWLPDVHPSEREVERIVEVGIGDLGSGSLLRIERREWDGFAMEIPHFALGGDDKLWGATAMIVAELLAVLGMDIDPWAERR